MMRGPAHGLNGYWKTSLADRPDSWERGCLAASVLQTAQNLPGIVIRARPGAVRDAFCALLPKSTGRIHPSMTDEALLGGIDISATLSAGRVIRTAGLIQPGAILTVTMAERLTPHLATLLAQALDSVPDLQLILLDEGASSEETAPGALIERLPFFVDLNDVQYSDLPTKYARTIPKNAAAFTDDDLTLIASLASDLGVDSARAAQFAIRTAQWLAGLAEHETVQTDDLTQACSLTLAHKATQMPQEDPTEEQADENPAPQEQADTDVDDNNDQMQLPQDLVLEAVLASLPKDLLQRMADPKTAGNNGSGAGAKRVGNRRGRPLPPRKTTRISGQTLDLYATLRQAVPWQPIRREESARESANPICT